MSAISALSYVLFMLNTLLTYGFQYDKQHALYRGMRLVDLHTTLVSLKPPKKEEEFTDDNSLNYLDHVREFSCGHLHYRTLQMDNAASVLYVGAM